MTCNLKFWEGYILPSIEQKCFNKFQQKIFNNIFEIYTTCKIILVYYSDPC